jgi:hypothetical protein
MTCPSARIEKARRGRFDPISGYPNHYTPLHIPIVGRQRNNMDEEEDGDVFGSY